MWTHETSITIQAPPERVWALLADVPGWPRWNAGVASAVLHGPFASGSRFDMQLPGGGPLLQSTLLDVRPGECFIDETVFEGVLVRVTHALAPLAGGVRVTYRAEVEGPGAAEVGAGVSADFSDVLSALKTLAERADDARLTALALYDQWSRLWNGELDVADAIIAPGFVAHLSADASQPPAPPTDAITVKQWVRTIRALGGGLRYWREVGPLVDGAYVTAWWHVQSAPGATAAIDKVGCDALRIAQGRIAECWTMNNRAPHAPH